MRAQKFDDVTLQVVVIDDGSSDGTRKALEARPDLYDVPVFLDQNGGKGAAVKAGLGAATGDYILFQDADLEYDPVDYHALFEPMVRFDADMVLGSRFLAPRYIRVFYFWHKVGNKVITTFFNLLNNTTFTDLYSCYVMYRRSLLQPNDLKSSGWEQHAEIICDVLKSADQVYEVPISYHGRSYEEGKKIRAHHVIPVLGMIVKKRFGA